MTHKVTDAHSPFPHNASKFSFTVNCNAPDSVIVSVFCGECVCDINPAGSPVPPPPKKKKDERKALRLSIIP